MSEHTGLAEASAPYNGFDHVWEALEQARSRRAQARRSVVAFLSHKHRDYEAAKKIREVLRFNSACRIDVFMSEQIPKGDDWQEKIEAAMYESDWFLLLFSGVDDDWSWCHQETGIFRGMTYPKRQRLVVLYPPNVELPKPLHRYQAVKCAPPRRGQPDDLDQFFRELFGEPVFPGFEPINPVFANEDTESRKNAAEKIIEAVGRLVVNTIEPDNIMIVHVPDINEMNPSAFPNGSEILRGSSSLRLFEVGDTGFCWNEFLEVVEESLRLRLEGSLWPAVYEACSESVRRRRIMPIHAIFRAPADQKNYRPILTRIEVTGDNSATFRISFVPAAAASQEDVRHKSVARIFTALNLAHRFRWEIIDPYRNPEHLQAFLDHGRTCSAAQGDAGKAPNGAVGLGKLWDAVRLIEIEAENRGVNDPELLPQDFGPPHEPRVRDMFVAWGEKRRLLEQAARADDVASFAGVLRELDSTNVEFISMASQRLAELVRADAGVQDR
jgi:hypothetical protein